MFAYARYNVSEYLGNRARNGYVEQPDLKDLNIKEVDFLSSFEPQGIRAASPA